MYGDAGGGPSFLWLGSSGAMPGRATPRIVRVIGGAPGEGSVGGTPAWGTAGAESVGSVENGGVCCS